MASQAARRLAGIPADLASGFSRAGLGGFERASLGDDAA